MNDQTPGADEIESEQAYVVYDPRSGRIVHIHTVVTFRGATGRSDAENEERALAETRVSGHKDDGLRVLRVKPAEIDESQLQRVDTQRQRLVLEHSAEASG